MTDGLWKLGAAELAALIRRKPVSAREATLDSLERIAAIGGTPNSVVLRLSDEALDAADRALLSGDPIRPLHGVPVTTKINTDQKRVPSDFGFNLLKDRIATEDNPTTATPPTSMCTRIASQ
jgi:amidase